jgi:FMN phosphatase YigB (HAD superfamily)
VARALGRFPDGVYLADDLLRSEVPQPAGAAFALALSAFVRSPVRLHFADEDEEVAALRRAGFGSVTLHRPDDGVVRVIEAALG